MRIVQNLRSSLLHSKIKRIIPSPLRRRARVFLLAAVLLPLLLLTASSSFAGSATWNLNPTNNTWYSASNWTPATVPNTISDTATFGVSNVTAIYYAPGGLLTNLGTFAFNPGASAYSINFANNLYPAMIGAGVMNDSGVLQAFSIPASGEFRDQDETNNMVSFINSATAGILTQWTVKGSGTGAYRPGELFFNDTATGASATFIVEPGGSDIGGEDGDGFGGILDFRGSSTADQSTINVNGGAAGADYGSPPNVFFTDNATAANATITTTGGTIPLGYGGVLDFFSNSTAATATITNQGGAVSGARPGQTTFWDTATAGNAIVIANAGTNGSSGGLVRFLDNATGGTARCELFGNGTLDIGFHLAPGVTVGSLEGDGSVLLGANNLTIGSNNLSTTFGGIIQNSGSVTKIGTRKLTFSGANTYTGGTMVNAGNLLVANQLGSGTGTGPVQVNAGKLGGTGRIRGSVTIGTGSGPGAFLTPGTNPNIPATLTIGKKVRFKADGTFHFGYKSSNATADKIVVRGVSIESGAQFFFGPIDLGTLPLGTVFTAIDNTTATPNAGTFANVPDGSVITIGNNTFQANYEGGDGNDLTLTVVP
jgi:autotransporter-associated beta strand protein